MGRGREGEGEGGARCPITLNGFSILSDSVAQHVEDQCSFCEDRPTTSVP